MPRATKGRSQPKKSTPSVRGRKPLGLTTPHTLATISSNFATRMLPPGMREEVTAFIESNPANDEILRACMGVLLHQQGRILAVYQDDCARYEKALKEAAKLHRSAKKETDSATRKQLIARAAALEAARPNHEGMTLLLGATSDRVRKITDSLTIQNPAHFSRIEVVMTTGDDDHDVEPWSAPPEGNCHLERSELEEEYLRQVRPDLREEVVTDG